jgi:hypothetical protein
MFRKVIRDIGIWGYIAFGALALLFVIGEILDDPGGSQAVLFVVACVVPLALLVFLVIKRVAFIKPLMVTLSGVATLFGMLSAIIPRQWETFRFTNGPILGIAVLVITIAMAWWARYEARLAGLLMMAITLLPLIAESIGQGRVHIGGSSFALMFPGALAGLLIALSAERD